MLDGRVSDDPTGMKWALHAPINTVNETGEALKDASRQLGRAAKKVDELLDSEQGPHSRRAGQRRRVARRIRNVLGDKETQQRLAEAMKKMPDTLDTMNQTFRSADKSLRAFTRPSGPDQNTAVERMVETVEMTERMLRKFNESSDPNKPPPADQIADAMENINEITRADAAGHGPHRPRRRLARGAAERPAVVRPAEPGGGTSSRSAAT